MLRRWFLASLSTAPGWQARAQSAAHPRLFVDAKRVAQIREAITGTDAAAWKPIRAMADSLAAQKPAAYHEGKETNDEQLWQREVGNKLPYLAMAYLLTGEGLYVEAATKWALASCSYPHWGTGIRDGVDLAAGHQLLGLALVYDWLHGELKTDAREEIKRTLIKRGGAIYDAARGRAYWKNSFLQNHLWVNAVGLFAAALALDGEPGTDAWIELARDKFRRTEAALGSDGASHEGVGYWDYGVEYLLKFQHLAERFGDRASSPWWKYTAAYRLYLGLPRNSWTKAQNAVDIGDSPRHAWYGPDYQLRRLAAMNRDGHAQWLAAEQERAGLTVPAASWLNLLWYDPGVAPKPPGDLPTLRHFADMGIVSARSNWSGDESLVVFKCGPPLGHEATDKFDTDVGSGHVHPDANHFVILGGGEFLIRDDGYAWKLTGQHNTLLIDGIGQVGEGGQWFRGLESVKKKLHPRVLKAVSSADVDEIAGDATAIYPAASGLRRFVRRLIFMKPDVLIVVDDIETDQPRKLELRFHPEYAFERQEDGTLLARGKKATLRMEALTPEGVEISNGPTVLKEREGKDSSIEAACLRTTRSKWSNAVAFSWSAAGVNPVRVRMERDGDRRVFHAGARRVQI